jgi:hypothetical protein
VERAGAPGRTARRLGSWVETQRKGGDKRMKKKATKKKKKK